MAQSVTYNSDNGVYTYKLMNVSGAYALKGNFDFSRAIDEKGRWTWQMNAGAGLDRSVDHARFEGEAESRENIVNTLTLRDNAYVQYSRNAFNVSLSGSISWRHSEGRMYVFSVLDALDFQYGLSARYTLPRIKTTLSAGDTLYGRRGYGNAALDADDCVINASVSQSMLKGKLIARLEAFDLLHQLSSMQYAVNAQGRTETWYRAQPHYVMLHVVYHWSRSQKRK